MCIVVFMKTHADVIDLWPKPSIRTFADDIGVPYVNAQLMRYRKSIAVDHWETVVDAAARRGFDGVTMEVLARLKRKDVGGKHRPSKRARYQPAA